MGLDLPGRKIRRDLQAEVASILELFAAERVRLVSFREEMADLETAFMALTQGKLA